MEPAEIMLYHVRYHLNRVIKKVLGKELSDYCMDIYTADQMICDELIREFDKLRIENRILWLLLCSVLVIALIMIKRL